MASYNTVLIIQELSADGSVYRSATLSGPGLPLMGAEWGIENDLVTEWYPGNPLEATQQVMARKEMPSAWRGEWNLTRLVRSPNSVTDEDGATSSAQDPKALYDFVEAMFSTGRLLRVTWATEQASAGDDGAYPFSASIVRTGRCKQFKGEWRTIFDVEWSVEFHWSGRGASTTKVASTRDATIANNSAAYASALDAIVEANQYAADQVADPSALTLGQLEQLASYPTTVTSSLSRQMLQLEDDLGSIVAIASTAAAQPASVVSAAVAHARNAKALAEQSYQTLSGLGVETLTNRDDALAVIQAHRQFAQQQDAQLQAAAAAFAFLLQVRRTIPRHAMPLAGALGPQASGDATTVLAAYTVVQGDTVARISQRFYQSPDHAVDILRANGLSWHTQLLPPGTRLVIPAISSAAVGT